MTDTPVMFGDHRYPHHHDRRIELSRAAVFESGLQHFADSAESWQEQSADVREFLAGVPAVWDETRHIAGEPGQFVVIARRRESDWYVGEINGSESPRRIDVALDFLEDGGYETLALTDGSSRDDVHVLRTIETAASVIPSRWPRGVVSPSACLRLMRRRDREPTRLLQRPHRGVGPRVGGPHEPTLVRLSGGAQSGSSTTFRSQLLPLSGEPASERGGQRRLHRDVCVHEHFRIAATRYGA